MGVFGKIPYKNHARRHLPGGSDPLPFGNMPYAWMERSADITVATGTEELIEDYEVTGGAPGTAFSYDATNGQILINETGQFMVAASAAWTALAANPTVPNPSYVRADLNFTNGYPVGDMINALNYNMGTRISKLAVYGYIAIEELNGAPDDFVEAFVGQSSGVSRDVTRAYVLIAKLSDL